MSETDSQTSSDGIPDKLEGKLRQLADRQSVAPDVVFDVFHTELEEVREEQPDLDRIQAMKVAFAGVKGGVIHENSMGGGGDQCHIIAIGHGGIRNWVDRDHENYVEGAPRDQQPKYEVLVAFGLVSTPDDPWGLGALTFSEKDDIDLGKTKQHFEIFEPLQARMSVSESDAIPDGWRVYSTGDTEVEPAEETLVGDGSEQARRQKVREFVDEVDLANITTSVSQTEIDNNGNQRTADFGIDLKRLSNATVLDHYIDTDGGWARYNLHDDSVLDDEDVPDAALDPEGRGAGLTAWTPPEQVEHGVGSVIDAYGYIERDDDHRITMNVVGIDADAPGLRSKPIEQSTGSGESETQSF